MLLEGLSVAVPGQLRACALAMQVLRLDAGNVEATACLGSYRFYSDQPEIAMIYFRRILQLGRPRLNIALADWYCGCVLELMYTPNMWNLCADGCHSAVLHAFGMYRARL